MCATSAREAREADGKAQISRFIGLGNRLLVAWVSDKWILLSKLVQK